MGAPLHSSAGRAQDRLRYYTRATIEVPGSIPGEETFGLPFAFLNARIRVTDCALKQLASFRLIICIMLLLFHMKSLESKDSFS